jgi:hypothetical protein
MNMRHRDLRDEVPMTDDRQRLRWPLFLLTFCALTVLVAFLLNRRHHDSDRVPVTSDPASPRLSTHPLGVEPAYSQPHPARHAPVPEPTAEEIVARKLAEFSRTRREFADALARRHNVQVSQDVERFFAAVESGDWKDIEAAFQKINGGDSSAGHTDKRAPDIEALWPAIIDAYGVAEQVHLWPAQKLLDYGNAVLGALRPGMVYVGGTDNGRWIPELLNDTNDGERHIIVTQNALADSTYVDYMGLQYDDRLATLSEEESKRAFTDYVSDAQKRLEHDQQFPDEPKQIRPGEDVRIVDGNVQVSGQIAVMAINEKLLQALMQKNPDLTFAIQESFPLRGTYADALPLGPLMELRARDEQNTFTAERAAQSLDYWRNVAQQILSDTGSTGLDSALKSWSHDTVAAANLLASHSFGAEAEAAYRLGTQLWLGNPESVGGLADLLAASGRENEARQLLDDFTQQYPDQLKDLERTSSAMRFLWTAKSTGP